MLNVIFLHGLLGTASDWQDIIKNLTQFRCIALDLPFHGAAQQIEVTDFDEATQYLAKQISNAVLNEPYVLVGYSLGGRLALHYALQSKADKGKLRAVILEGANLGLKTEQERQARLRHDKYWAKRFGNEAPESVLDDWYRQPVFAHLTEADRIALIQKRQAQCGANIGNMLLATSLAKQADFSPEVQSNAATFFYFCGEHDQKFQKLARNLQLNLTTIPQAGHNAHAENPEFFAKALEKLILKIAQT